MADSPYCTSAPTQLRAWDSTALRCYMECPRKYQLAQTQGWRAGSNIHIEFGHKYHECLELYDRLRATGTGKDDATMAAVEHCLALTWIDGAPWSGQYVPVWRCNNWVPHDPKSKAKTPRPKYNCDAAKGWWAGTRETCSHCGGSVTCRMEWVPEDKIKNRYTLLRSVLLYCDEQPEHGGVEPLVFPDGTVALELSFRIPLPIATPDGDPYQFCGHLDSMVSFAGEHCVRERKTTKGTVSSWFFDKYAPDVQIDNYDLASYLLYHDTLKPTCIMVEVMQVAVNFSRLQRGLITITEGRREETLRDLQYWIKQAEANALEGYYPKNTASCNANGGCPFRRVCKEEPGAVREAILQSHYRQEFWNPLEER